MALGRLFTIAANYTDPSVFFVGGGVVESTPAFRDWFMGEVREHTVLREEQAALATFAVVPDLFLRRVVRRCDVKRNPALRREPDCAPVLGADPVIQPGATVLNRLIRGGLGQA